MDRWKQLSNFVPGLSIEDGAIAISVALFLLTFLYLYVWIMGQPA